ncbi:MAG: sulfatase [Myxococcota bacterium]
MTRLLPSRSRACSDLLAMMALVAVSCTNIDQASRTRDEAAGRLLRRVMPTPETPRPVWLGKKLRETWHVSSADLAALDGPVALRLGHVRRHARIVHPPATFTVRTPPSASEVTFWVAPPLFEGKTPAQCGVILTYAWALGGEPHRVRLEVNGERTPAWRQYRLTVPARAERNELRIRVQPDTACGKARIVTAVSEVTSLGSVPPPALENVILVVLDTLRRDAMDCAETSAEITPNIVRRWCGRGTFFSSAFATAPWTYPSLASMLTGLEPGEHGGEGMNREARDIRREIPTLAEILRWNGYSTSAVVSNWQATRGLWRGFDTFIELMPRLGEGAAEERRAEYVVNHAIAWLDTEAREPFSLWTLFIDLHEPVDAVRKTGTQVPECADEEPIPFRWQRLGKPATPPGPELVKRMACRTALYQHALAYIDRELGRLMDYLEARGLDGRTHVVLLSDHGEEFWDHATEQRTAGVTPRGIWGIGHGHTLYAELIHVPFLVVRAGGHAAVRSDALVSITDVFPTVLGLAGVPASTTGRGQDLSRVVDSDWQGTRRVVTSASIAYGPPRRSVTTAGLRAIHTDPDNLVVFDRRADPSEKKPLPADAPLAVEGRRVLRRGFDERGRISMRTPADREALRALGYVR